MKFSTRFLAPALAALLLAACTNENKKAEVTAADVVNNPATANGAAENPANAAEAKITWEEDAFDFGKVITGQKVQHRYKFKNSGESPLIISNAAASCGCTVPTWTREPIAPGDTGSIFVEFNSENRMGPQEKTVTVTANTNPSTHLLKLTGRVDGLAEKGPVRQ